MHLQYVCTNKWAYMLVYSTPSSFQSKKKKKELRVRNPTQLADVHKNKQSEYWQCSSLLCLLCTLHWLCPSPPLKRQTKKEAGMSKEFGLILIGHIICIICKKGIGSLKESWLKKKSQWIHISAATDWTWSFPNYSQGTHEKSSRNDEQERRENVEERRESGEVGRLQSTVIPFFFHRGIKSKLAGFSMIRKNHSRVFISYRRAVHHEFYVFFYVSFYIFIKPLCRWGKFKYSLQ